MPPENVSGSSQPIYLVLVLATLGLGIVGGLFLFYRVTAPPDRTVEESLNETPSPPEEPSKTDSSLDRSPARPVNDSPDSKATASSSEETQSDSEETSPAEQARQFLAREFTGLKFSLHSYRSILFALEETDGFPGERWYRNLQNRLPPLLDLLDTHDLLRNPASSDNPGLVVVLGDEEKHNRYLDEKGYSFLLNSFYVPNQNLILLYHDADEPFRPAIHELLHMLTDDTRQEHPPPFWMMEGMAMTLEESFAAGAVDPEELTVPPNRQRHSAWESYRYSGHMISFRDLLNLTHPGFDALLKRAESNLERVNISEAVYAQAWGLTYYLWKTKGPGSFADYMTRVGEGQEPVQVYEDLFGPVDTHKREYATFLDRLDVESSREE